MTDRICLAQPKARAYLIDDLGYAPEAADALLEELRVAAVMNGVRYYYVDELPAPCPGA